MTIRGGVLRETTPSSILTHNNANNVRKHTVVKTNDPLNTSDHIAVNLKLTVGYEVKEKRKNPTQQKPNGINVIQKHTRLPSYPFL